MPDSHRPLPSEQMAGYLSEDQMNTVKVLVADDHAILRSGLRLMIEAQPDMEVVGEVPDCNAAVQKVVELKPDVVVMDCSFAGGSACAAIEAIRRKSSSTHVLVLCLVDDPTCPAAVMAAGASGLVHKGSETCDLFEAIRAV